jgi:integrase
MGVRVRQKIKGKGNPWWVFVSLNGKRTSKRFNTKAAAMKVAPILEAKLATGKFSFEPEKPPAKFKEYAESWIKTTVPATCKASTASDYKAILYNHILPVFGKIAVNDITRGKIKDFLLQKSNDGFAASTVLHMKNVISGILIKALDDETLASNPAAGLSKLIKKADSKANIDPLNKKEVTQLLNTVAEHFTEHYPLFLFLARTGCRIGEALALKWEDIDFRNRSIEIQRSLVRDRISTPKNGKSRKVDMSYQLTEVLKAKMYESPIGEAGEAPEYVFTNTVGNLIDKNNWRNRVFYKAIEKADLRRIRIHDLRHSYATIRISNGDNIGDVSNQLGHHSVKLTLDIYYHWLPGSNKAEVDALDDPTLVIPTALYMHPDVQKNKRGYSVLPVTP